MGRAQTPVYIPIAHQPFIRLTWGREVAGGFFFLVKIEWCAMVLYKVHFLWSVTHKIPSKPGQILFSTEGFFWTARDTIFHAAWQRTSKLGKELFVFGMAYLFFFKERCVIVLEIELVAPYMTPIRIGYLSIMPGLKMSGSLIKWNAYVYQHGISSRIRMCGCVCVWERESTRWCGSTL